MFTDIIELREFYQSPRGQAAAAAVQPWLAQTLLKNGAQPAARLVVYGYAPPTLLPPAVLSQSLALMPAPQGVTAWPDTGANRAALVEENTLPLADQSVDVLLLMHALENCGNPQTLLRECWRVLHSNGQLLLVVPNRRGLWARAEGTPFGRGSPYTATQLRAQLRAAQFMAQQWQRVLFVPPFKSRALLYTARAWDYAGSRLWPNFGGLLVLQATKQLYAPSGLLSAATSRRFAPNLLAGTAT